MVFFFKVIYKAPQGKGFAKFDNGVSFIIHCIEEGSNTYTYHRVVSLRWKFIYWAVFYYSLFYPLMSLIL